jgi:hypothetical protein
MVVPDESGTDVTVDYGVGLSGVIGFLLRLRYGGPRMLMADVDRPPSASPERQAEPAGEPVAEPVGGPA